VVSFAPRPLYPGKIAPSVDCIGDWVFLRAVLDAVEKRKIFLPVVELVPSNT
jgi:hypothetical protein